MKVNPETLFTDAGGKLTQDGFNALVGLQDAADAVARAVAAATDMWAGNIAYPTNKTLTLVQNCAFAGTITVTTTKSASGTATFTFKVNTTALDGTANSVSGTENIQAHATAFAIGDDIVLTITSASSCIDAAFSLHFTRTAA